MRVGYLGPPGTFSEEAVARCEAVRGAEAVPFPTFADAHEALLRGELDAALLPIENSIEGAVSAVLDLLVHRPGARIRAELLLQVRQHLLARPGTRLEQVRRVLSHPQPLGQCARFLRARLPAAALEPALSTAEAARKVAAGEPDAAALGPRRAAERYGLEVLAENVQDSDENVTRFVLLAREDAPPSGADRTSIAFTLDRDRPGGLYEVMGEFARRGINLSKIESRPTKQAMGHYVFYLDFEGHRADPAGASALEGVREQVHELHLLGSYPRTGAPV
ncbi:Prephenate dehydratase [Anaeromyxobacter sp. K]|uniref:Prephenate dehydratase n=1 Tax=Anaeromyxobacter dehalogenans (strain ATCC BAA-258 / DSM 21875 / 2CP-1) TaxID=455488 RepID=B8J987_ANAD2|nr:MULTISPECIES: prephenate dehydratase [Anaeromyxobacter]ACG73289.1 Prephenate dehydratase [Anaeromyxobacter sp. K]ACL65493.1 Prephenate dehydratase [Anaeromyxobacter dehalogenans 2CP-1]